MGELSSKFSRVDIETLLEAMGDWEALGNQEWHLMNMVKNTPMPPEDHEAHEMVVAIKDHFFKREKDINDSRVTRQERAVLLKAKLIMVRRDMGINQLFEMAAEETPADVAVPADGASVPAVPADSAAAKLERAEYFIRDLGVWSHYEKFLSEQK